MGSAVTMGCATSRENEMLKQHLADAKVAQAKMDAAVEKRELEHKLELQARYQEMMRGKVVWSSTEGHDAAAVAAMSKGDAENDEAWGELNNIQLDKKAKEKVDKIK